MSNHNERIPEGTVGRVIDRDALEERAAIIEFEGNLSRDEAERNAVDLALVNHHRN